jgi:triphosphatase
MSDDREIELKLACTPRDFDAALAAAPAGEERTRSLTSVYFDTPDGRLAKAGVALRVREIEGVRTQTLKRGSGLSREEYEKKIKGERPDASLGPLKDLLDKQARAALAPIFEIAVTRRERRLSHAGADIEMALDDGEARAGAERSPIAEVELELKAGDPAALFDLARLLADAAPLYLSFEGKADRGRALAGGRRRPPRPWRRTFRRRAPSRPWRGGRCRP